MKKVCARTHVCAYMHIRLAQNVSEKEDGVMPPPPLACAISVLFLLVDELEKLFVQQVQVCCTVSLLHTAELKTELERRGWGFFSFPFYKSSGQVSSELFISDFQASPFISVWLSRGFLITFNLNFSGSFSATVLNDLCMRQEMMIDKKFCSLKKKKGEKSS